MHVKPNFVVLWNVAALRRSDAAKDCTIARHAGFKHSWTEFDDEAPYPGSLPVRVKTLRFGLQPPALTEKLHAPESAGWSPALVLPSRLAAARGSMKISGSNAFSQTIW